MKKLTERQKQILNSILNQEWYSQAELETIFKLAKAEYGHQVIKDIIEIMKTWND